MSQNQIINQLKFRISSLETQLVDKQKIIDEYKTIQNQTDGKIKSMSKIHAEKIKTLLNSIQILKKQKASIQNLSKQHKRSKLIQQLNKEISDQDLVIEVLRKYVYDKQGKDKGRSICDQIIIKALTKGPQRIRPLSRQQLRIEIDKLKSIVINLQSKLKNSFKSNIKDKGKDNNNDAISQVSQPSQQSFINHNQTILNKLKDLQFENQNLKLDINSKLKIIQKLKNEQKQKNKYKIQTQLLKNQIQMLNKKIDTYQRLLKDSKNNTNNKIQQWYQKQMKNQNITRQHAQKLKQFQQNHQMITDDMKNQIDTLKNQNQQLILENIQLKKQLQQLKNKNKDIIDQYQKSKLKQGQFQRIVLESKNNLSAYRKIQAQLFAERAKWVQQKAQLLQQLSSLRNMKGQSELINKYMEEIDELKAENKRLKQIIQQGGGGASNDNLLLERLQNYKRKVQYLQSNKSTKTQQSDIYNQLFKKYNDLADQFQQYKSKYKGPSKKIYKQKQIIQISKQQQNLYENLTSGISSLNLPDINSDILDNFNSSYQYQIVIRQDGKKVKIPKITQADKQLLKLINSDLWYFVDQKQIPQQKLIQNSQIDNQYDNFQADENLRFKMRNLTNLNNPRGKKIVMIQQQVQELQKMSDNVSITSGRNKQLDKFNSDVDIQIKKVKYDVPKNLNIRNIDKISLSSGSSVDMSNAKSGDSNIGKKKKVIQKGTVLTKNTKLDKISSDIESIKSQELLNSDVSSSDISITELNKIDSDIDHDFKKKKK